MKFLPLILRNDNDVRLEVSESLKRVGRSAFRTQLFYLNIGYEVERFVPQQYCPIFPTVYEALKGYSRVRGDLTMSYNNIIPMRLSTARWYFNHLKSSNSFASAVNRVTAGSNFVDIESTTELIFRTASSVMDPLSAMPAKRIDSRAVMAAEASAAVSTWIEINSRHDAYSLPHIRPESIPLSKPLSKPICICISSSLAFPMRYPSLYNLEATFLVVGSSLMTSSSPKKSSESMIVVSRAALSSRPRLVFMLWIDFR